MTTSQSAAPVQRQTAPASSRSFASGGFAFVGLLLVTFALQGGTQPTRESSAASVKAYFDAHAGNIEASEVLVAFGVAALLWWLGGVWLRLRAADGEFAGAGTAAVAGFAAGVALVLVDIALYATAAVGASRFSDGAELLLFDLSTAAVLLSGLGLAVFLAATCVLNRRARFFPGWTDYLGSATAIGFMLAATGIATESNTTVAIGYAASLAWCLWVTITSVSMWRRHA
jgi:hypothetical protein